MFQQSILEAHQFQGKRLYLSGPITKGNGTYNFAVAAQAQEILMRHGGAVLNPMLSMMHPNAKNIPWETWIASDLPWVEVADMVIRLPGESKGADAECDLAARHRVPVWRAQDVRCLNAHLPVALLTAA